MPSQRKGFLFLQIFCIRYTLLYHKRRIKAIQKREKYGFFIKNLILSDKNAKNILILRDEYDNIRIIKCV